MLNPAALKQLVLSTAVPLPHLSAFEQGAGMLDPVRVEVSRE